MSSSSSSSSSSSNQRDDSLFDVCIVGAGPAALACLSAIREPYTLDTLTPGQLQHANKHLGQKTKALRVAVVDPHEDWMAEWRENFATLDIQHLRSPAMAHPDMYDSHSLLAFAALQQHQQHGKDGEYAFLDSGCGELKALDGLGQETGAGLWKLPSSKVFQAFCQHQAQKLEHSYFQGYASRVECVPNESDLDKDASHDHDDGDDNDAHHYRLEWVEANNSKRHQTLRTRFVVLAMGMVGRPVIPPGLRECPMAHPWKSPLAFGPSTLESSSETGVDHPIRHVLVVGGGLTAVQAALKVANEPNTQCTLCSRRPLQENHFDIPVQWFDRRTAGRLQSDFYHEPVEERLAMLKEARDGGSVPPMYMKRLRQAMRNQRIHLWVGDDIDYVSNPTDAHTSTTTTTNHGPVAIRFQNQLHEFQEVILACGTHPDCRTQPLVRTILEQWPIPVEGGLPCLTQDLRWSPDETIGAHNILVVGALAALQVGPDAGNLMGIRRAAATIASNALQCRKWIRETTLVNKFGALAWSDSESDSSSIGEESEDDDGESCVSSVTSSFFSHSAQMAGDGTPGKTLPLKLFARDQDSVSTTDEDRSIAECVSCCGEDEHVKDGICQIGINS